ncbi:hypothetical protein NBRC116590_01890 [Pelagimonas sp. KU-00592-HH]|uniref:hypothetical protein n=1 Tax=Roseobacteraceae TaxID=2854170 RepID=UPI0020CB7B46|nr:hypothetical protein [Shimia sp. CNT1-13L.2]MCP9483161.1 hypothetical protein [Shimia sp. CNT1-13L.2]
MGFLNFLNASRLMQSSKIDELVEALGEDDDGPDGGSFRRRKRDKHLSIKPRKRKKRSFDWFDD